MTGDTETPKQPATHPLALVRAAYHLAFWVFLLPFFTGTDNGAGFIAFSILILVRLVLNLYTNNVLHLTQEGYDRYPFRIP